MTYEDLEVLPSANFESFSTALLNYPYGFSCWCIVLVKVKLTEAIISARMTYFNILPYHH